MADPFSIRCPSKAMKRLMRFAMHHGWQVERTNGGHLRFLKRGCPPVFTGFSPSDVRAEKNMLARLRRVQRQEEDKA